MTKDRPHIKVTCLPEPPDDSNCMVLTFSNGQVLIMSMEDGARLKAFLGSDLTDGDIELKMRADHTALIRRAPTH